MATGPQARRLVATDADRKERSRGGEVSTGRSEPIYDVTVQRDVLMPMRDGTRLAGDLYLPASPGAWPTLVERTPYSKASLSEIGVSSPEFFASRGYAVLIQDTRGRFKSE